MSGPILITVANLLRKTHNRLFSSAFLSGRGRLARQSRSQWSTAPMKAINSRCPSDHGHMPAANPILGSIPRRAAPTSNPLEECSEPDSSEPDLTKAKAMPSSRSKEGRNTGNPQ
jgi:hypothetical protein